MMNPGQKFEEAIRNSAIGWGQTSTGSPDWVGPRKSPRKSLRFLYLSPYVTRNHRNRNFLVLRHVGPCGHSVKYPSGSTVCIAVALKTWGLKRTPLRTHCWWTPCREMVGGGDISTSLKRTQ